GNYSLKLFNTAAFAIVASGTLTNGRVHADFNPELGYVFTQHDDDRWHTAFSSHPDSLVFWYKAFPVGNDFGKVRVILHVDEGKFPENGTFQNWIGEAIYYFPQQQVTEWTRVSVPFTYHLSGNSEYLLCVCNSGNGYNAVEGSEAYFDDLELIYNPEWIHETILEGVSLYTYNNSIVLKIDRPSDFSQLQMEIFDLTGRSLLSRQFNPSPELVCPVNLRQGMYICRIMSGNGIYTSKVYFR
ncbi:MAG: T9SS type A sorting domain-containing protein, partial [Bacteroidota bacterium]|nr:T9SS type A sorting domain-containing protein [Bacteroidota bacterium]